MYQYSEIIEKRDELKGFNELSAMILGRHLILVVNGACQGGDVQSEID